LLLSPYLKFQHINPRSVISTIRLTSICSHLVLISHYPLNTPMNHLLLRPPAIALFALTTPAAFSQAPAAVSYAENLAKAKQQLEQAKIQIEQIKLQQAENRINRNEAAVSRLDVELKRYQNLIALKQQEIAMYQQQETFTKQPLSTNPAIATAQNAMRQYTLEKAQLGLRQTIANQAGNQPQADLLNQQISTLQLRITAKQQEIRLLEMKAKTNQ
jgi:hypothetical protein